MIGTLARKRTNWAALAVLAGLVVALFAVLNSAQAQPANVIVYNDSDATVAAGTDLQARLVAAGPTASFADSEVTVARWHVSGAGQVVFSDTAGTITTADTVTIVTTGAAGEFTLTATVGTTNFTGTFTVGEPGDAVSTVEISLGNEIAVGDSLVGGGTATADDVSAEDGVSAADGWVNIVVSVKNSLGEAPNEDEVNTIIVFADTTGRVASGRVGPTATPSTIVNYNLSTTDEDETATANVGASNNFSIGAVDTAKGGTVEVRAIAIGAGKRAESNVLTLTFSGGPNAISAGTVNGGITINAAGNASGGSAWFDVTATSAADTPVTANAADTALALDNTDLSTVIKDADGETVTTQFTVTEVVRLATDDASTTAIDETKVGKNAVAIVIAPATGSTAKAGAYTAEVTLDEGSKNTVTAVFNVVGALANIEASVDMETVAIGDEVTVTAMLTDANGLPVADGQANVADDTNTADVDEAAVSRADDVRFVATGSLKLIGYDENNDNVVFTEVKNGVAKATFLVSEGSGLAIIRVVSGSINARATVSTEGTDAAADGPSLDDFSRLSGVAAYTGPAATASDLLALLAGRATIIWLSDGDNWTAYYALIDGSEAPGSSNFTVRSGDVLYIGN
ncbi:MAG: hypothetical protein F4X17_09580 [Gemmatimonadetes bacterium]|nr:hypothetical protein [Gemmatimonadota bacterium]